MGGCDPAFRERKGELPPVLLAAGVRLSCWRMARDMWMRDPGSDPSAQRGGAGAVTGRGLCFPGPARVYRDGVYSSTREGHLPQACLPVLGRNEALRRRLEVFLKEPEGPDWKQNGLSYWNDRLFSHPGKRLKRSLHSPKSHSRLPQPQVVSVPAPAPTSAHAKSPCDL